MTLKLRITSLFLSFILILSLCACDLFAPETTAPTSAEEAPFVPTDANELWNKMNEVMAAQTGYSEKMESSLTIYYSGFEMVSIITANGTYDRSDGTLRYYFDGSFTSSSEEMSYSDETKTMEAFCDGKYYLSVKNADYDQKLCAPMTEEEYRDMSQSDMLTDVDFLDCTRREFAEADGGWSMKFSGYTKKAVHSFLEFIELTEEDLGAAVEDMETAVATDAEFRCLSLSVKLFFDVDESSTTKPEFSLSSSYADFDTAAFDPTLFVPEEFTQVDDLRILEDLPKAMEELASATEGKFSADLVLKTTVEGYGESEAGQHSQVSFGKKNGSIYYDLDMTLDGEKYVISYRNGLETVQYGGESFTDDISEREAQEFLSNLIDGAEFYASSVTGVEKKGEGVYLLHIEKVKTDLHASGAEESGVEITGGSQEITVTFNGDALQSIESTVIMAAVIDDGGQKVPVSYHIHSVVTVESATLPTA